MVRLADLPEAERRGHLERVRSLPEFPPARLVGGPPLSERRVAIVSTAGLHLLGDIAVDADEVDFRAIPGDAAHEDVQMSPHSEAFDRTAFESDWNAVFPLERLRELAADRVIGSTAASHYSFMGAIRDITRYEPKARELAGLLKDDRVDAVLLSPV